MVRREHVEGSGKWEVSFIKAGGQPHGQWKIPIGRFSKTFGAILFIVLFDRLGGEEVSAPTSTGCDTSIHRRPESPVCL